MASTGDPKKFWYSIPEAAKFIDRSETYVRQLVRDGTFKTTMVPIDEGYDVKKHMIHITVLREYLEGPNRRNRRDDGRNKYYFYATPAEFAEHDRLMREAGPHMTVLADLITPANIRKPEL